MKLFPVNIFLFISLSIYWPIGQLEEMNPQLILWEIHSAGNLLELFSWFKLENVNM